MARKNRSIVGFEDENDGGSEDEEVNFSDPEGYVDDIDDKELVGDILRLKPKETDSTESVVVVDGIPQVGQERLEKLKTVIRRLFKEFGDIVSEYYPMEGDLNKGYVFLEFKEKADAEKAVSVRNNYKLDKNHTLLCNVFTDFDKYGNIPEEFTPPAPQPYKDTGNLYYYLYEENCFDQFAVMYMKEDSSQEVYPYTTVYLNSVPKPIEIHDRKRWIQWSPLGTYMATMHNMGAALWGGEDFGHIIKFNHPEVQFIGFSPNEKYIVTFSPRTEDQHSLIIWDVLTGQKKRGFHAERVSVWPMFKWSHDDKYFARIGEDVLSVYETPSFGLLDKKSLKVPGIKDFSWSPTDNILAYWIAEDKNVPAKVSLISIPAREEVRTKNLFSVADCQMHWQKCGDYLCVKVARYAKAKREKNDVKYTGIYYNFEIFHMREKGIPVDSLEIKENIITFAWEPVNNKFGIISGEEPSVTFFQVNKGLAPSELKKFPKSSCNSMFWSPNGQFVVLAGLRVMNSTLEFVDTKDFAVMTSNEHFTVTDIEWDPTGRYVTSGVSYLNNKMDHEYCIWSFQGKLLRNHKLEKFCFLSWRPRPQSLLTSSDIKEIKKNMKDYASQFDLQDKMRSNKASKEIIEKRQQQMQDFRKFREAATQRHKKGAQERLNLRDGICLESNVEDDEEIVEFLIRKEVTNLEE